MSSTILTSPFLTLTIIDQLLAQPQTTIERVKLLSARLSLLTNPSPPSSSASTAASLPAKSGAQQHEAIVLELETRLKLGLAHLELVPPGLQEAEGELGIVERRCKGLLRPRKPKSQGETVDMKDEPLEGKGNAVERAAETEGDGRDTGMDEEWRARVLSLRVWAIEVLIHVEEARGRGGRAERWKEVLKQISSDVAGS